MMNWQFPRQQKCSQSSKSRRQQKKSDRSSNNLKISAKKPRKMLKNFWRNKSVRQRKNSRLKSCKWESSFWLNASSQLSRESRYKKLLSSRGFRAPKLCPLTRRSSQRIKQFKKSRKCSRSSQLRTQSQKYRRSTIRLQLQIHVSRGLPNRTKNLTRELEWSRCSSKSIRHL